ncbi:MAG: hypothetical protein ACP5GL_05060, partial [Infirmifilum sp.]
GVVSLEARPASGWRLKQLLVNGSPGVADWLRIRGNTSVTVVFWRGFEVRFTVYGLGGKLYVNGTPVGNASLVFEEPVLLFVEAVPLEGFNASLSVNGEPFKPCAGCRGVAGVGYRFDSDSVVEVRFQRRLYRVVVNPGGKHVYVNGSRVDEPVELALPYNSTLLLRGEIIPLDEKRDQVPVWRVSTFIEGAGAWLNYTLNTPNASLVVRGDTLIDAAWLVGYRSPRGGVGGVLYGGVEVPARVEASKLYVIPFTGNYSYLGNGTWRFWGGRGTFYVELPRNWSRVVLRVNVREDLGGYAAFTVVLKNDEYFLARGDSWNSGWERYTGSQFTFTFYRCILDAANPNWEKCFQITPKLPFTGHLQWGPSDKGRIEPGVQAGWLNIDVSDLDVEVQVLVEP